MLAIRMQRTGRKGHAQFRLIVQDSHRSPTSGVVVARLGSYDPHTKAITVDKERAGFYLEHGAQPSPRVAYILKQEGVKLPKWVKIETDRKRVIKNTDKLRRNRPEEPKAEEPAAEEAVESAPAETAAPEAEATAEETKTEVAAPETEAAPEEPAAEPAGTTDAKE